MKLELIIFGITGFLVYNAYHEGKYTKIFYKYKKYIQMITFAFVGFSIYLLLKRDPTKAKHLLLHTNNMIKYMPINRSTADLITPIFDFTASASQQHNSFMEDANSALNPGFHFNMMEPEEKRLLRPSKSTKRSVSGQKKKYVAYLQGWKCAKCDKMLNAWFEVDHKVRLEYGGGNDISNLVALCRECHGEKTAMENM